MGITVESHTNYNDERLHFHFSDDSDVAYVIQANGDLLGKMSENSEEQYKAVQTYAKDNLGGLSVLLNLCG